MTDIEKTIDTLLGETREQPDALDALKLAAAPPPAVQSLCLEQTLYSPIQLNPDRDDKFLKSLKFEEQQFDAHCVYCHREATFRTLKDRMAEDVDHAEQLTRLGLAEENLKRLILEDGQFALHLSCSRQPNHLYSYFFAYNEQSGILTKVGQMPSLEDVAGADIERYRKILGDDFPELRRATGLFAHGIGIGSFVYLRRIFENLVEAARIAADPKGEREEEFRRMRMTDRVNALSDHLPTAVVKFKNTYGILSRGLHELTEDDCKRHFPVVRAAVIMMLEERYEALEKAKAVAELERAVAAIASEADGA